MADMKSDGEKIFRHLVKMAECYNFDLDQFSIDRNYGADVEMYSSDLRRRPVALPRPITYSLEYSAYKKRQDRFKLNIGVAVNSIRDLDELYDSANVAHGLCEAVKKSNRCAGLVRQNRGRGFCCRFQSIIRCNGRQSH